jgi:hypothetical protein
MLLKSHLMSQEAINILKGDGIHASGDGLPLQGVTTNG